jgi:hypothetical protein
MVYTEAPLFLLICHNVYEITQKIDYILLIICVSAGVALVYIKFVAWY